MRSKACWRGQVLCVPALALALATAAAAQEPMPRVGISGAPSELTLREAVLLALEQNPRIRVQRETVRADEFALTARRGLFDPRLRSQFSLLSETIPVGSILAGGGSGSVSNDLTSGNFSLSQDLPSGGSFSALFDTRRSTTSNVFTQLDPQFPSSWRLAITVPLWRDLKIDPRRREVRVARRNLDQSTAELRRTVLDVVTEVRQSYWGLVLAREDVQVRREAVQLGREQVARNQRLLQAGQASPVDVVEAEAELQRRQEELLAAEERITNRENDLKQLILESRGADLWSRELVPADRGEQGRADVVLGEAWALASTLRPELEELRVLEASQSLDSEFFRNQGKPRLDLVAGYGSSGLAGSERLGDNPFSSQNVALAERVNLLSRMQGLQPLPPPAQGRLPETLVGGLGQSLQNLLRNNRRTAEIGLRLEFPLLNRTAEGELGRSLALEGRLAATRIQLEQRIEAEIRNSLQAVQTAEKRVEAAEAALVASREKLESERRLFQAGQTTNFLVLTRENDYTENRARKVRAEMDRNTAVARLQRTIGDALQTFQIRLDADPRP